MADVYRPPGVPRHVLLLVGVFIGGLFCAKTLGQIQGSAGQTDTKPFTASVALREGYDSNPLTAPYTPNYSGGGREPPILHLHIHSTFLGL